MGVIVGLRRTASPNREWPLREHRVEASSWPAQRAQTCELAQREIEHALLAGSRPREGRSVGIAPPPVMREPKTVV